jgi:hypothetical protein
MRTLFALLLLVAVSASAEPDWVTRLHADRPAWMQTMTDAERAKFNAQWFALIEQARIAREQAERDAVQQQIAAQLFLIQQQQAIQAAQIPRR